MTPKKNILFLINDLGSGGAEKVLVNLVNNLDKDKYNITVRTIINQGENKQYLADSVKYESVYRKGIRGIKYLYYLPNKYIYNKVAYGKFDLIVVYLHGVLTKIVANAPSSQKTINYLHANMHKSVFIKSFKSKEKLQACFKSYNAIVSVCKSVEDSFKTVSGIEENLHVIYNTFDVGGIKGKSSEKIDEGFNRGEMIQLCAIGTLKKVKGFDRLISALGRIKNEGIDFVLNIIGEGPDRALLQQLIKSNNLEDNIFLLGFKSNPYKYISKSDLFVCSSLSEGFSSVVVESTILGVPVITTDCSGMTEILGENNEYGIIVDNDEESLYLGLKNILLDKELLQHYKNKAKERASFFSTEKAVLDVENLIDKIIDNE